MDEIKALANKAVSPDLGERVAANNEIKELRQHGSAADKLSLMHALENYLLDDPDKAIYSGEALVELGDPAAIKQISEARNHMDIRGRGTDAWQALGESMIKLNAMGRSQSPEDAMRKLDAENVQTPKKPTKVR